MTNSEQRLVLDANIVVSAVLSARGKSVSVLIYSPWAESDAML